MLQGCSARAGFGADAPAFGRVGGLDVCHNVTATLRGGGTGKLAPSTSTRSRRPDARTGRFRRLSLFLPVLALMLGALGLFAAASAHAQAPENPTNFQVQITAVGAYTATWTRSASADSYRIDVQSSCSGSFQSRTVSGGTTETASGSGFGGATFCFRIRACASGSCSAGTQWLNVNTGQVGTYPNTATNANLSALTASTHTSSTGTFTALTLTPSTFSATTTSYTASVANARTHLKLTPTVAISGATVKVGKQGTTLATVTSGQPSAAIALSVGSNAITVEVTATDTTTKKTYTVTVTRQAATVWSATFTPQDIGGAFGIGCTNGGSGAIRCSTASTLSDDDFSVGANNYTIAGIQLFSDSSLSVTFETGAQAAPLASLRFCSGSNGHLMSGVSANTWTTSNTGFTWTAGTAVSLSIGTSCPQTMTPQSTDATLSGLTATQATSSSGPFTTLTIGTFASATTSYTATVANSVTHVKLTPTVNDSGATVGVRKGSSGSFTAVTSGSASAAIALSVGANTLVVRVTAEDTTTTKDYTVTVTRAAVLSSNANLSALTASSSTSSSGSFTNFSIGTFSASTTNYSATVANDQTHVKLTPTVADTGKATVSVRKGSSGNFASVTSGSASAAIALDVGSNTLVVRVTAEDTTTKDYTVTVTRAAALSSNANLSALTAGSSTSSTGTFTNFSIGTFSASTTNYSASVAADQTHVKLTPTVADTGKATVGVRKGASGNFASVTSGSASAAIALDMGANALVVRVTAEDSTTKDYTVTVTRGTITQSSNANLSALTAGSSTSSSGSFTNFSIGTFSASTTNYSATVANNQTHVKLTPTVADTGKATVGVRKGSSGDFTAVTSGSASAAIALSVGSNTLVVRVTAENGSTTKDYTVTVTRQSTQTQAAPTGLTVTPGVMQLRVSWTAPSGSFTGYRLDITSATASAVANGATASGSNPASAWVAVATPANTSTSYTIDSNVVTLTHGRLYRVRLRTTTPDSAWVFRSGTPQAPATEDESAALNLSLDGLARTLLSRAVGVIGERIAASDEPAPAIPEMDDADAWASATGLLSSAAATPPKKDPWDLHAQNSDRVTGDISWNRSFAFSLDAPSGSQSQTDDSQWRIWGTGDLQNFRRRQTSASSRGGWNTIYLGLERRVAGHWLGGLALASGRGKADYSYSEGAAEGRLELRLKAAYPYFSAVTAEGVEIWAMAGAGQGRATNSINGQEPHSGRLHMRMAAAGLRLKMADWPSVQLSALADAGAETLIIRGEQSLANLKSSVQRVRAGLELSGQGGEWSPYMRLNLRHEGGGGLSAAGLESEAGARYSHGRLGMDVRMRWMRLKGSGKYRESGAAATLRISPAADGTGLSLTLAPVRGRPDGTDLVWGASSLPSATPARAGDGLAMMVNVGYGIRPLQLPGLVTPTLGYARGAQGDERLRVGADYATELPHELRLGFGLERHETLGGADRSIRLDAQMRW